MGNGGIDSTEFFSALDELSKERRINKEVLFSAIEAALISAYKKNFGKNANGRATIDAEKGNVEVLSRSISFYVCVAVSGMIVLVGYLRQRKRERR